ncbi:hypothetical protein GQ600_9882 [Phytophthora cactorum]|nr:hypothetical protein GQ600_9882 [Phytophthora cactorum]
MISSPGAVVFVGLFRIICGRKVWRHILSKPNLVIRLMLFLSAQATTAIIHQGYSAAFRAASSTPFELPLIFVLPAIKFIMKNVVARFGTGTSLLDELEKEPFFVVDSQNQTLSGLHIGLKKILGSRRPQSTIPNELNVTSGESKTRDQKSTDKSVIANPTEELEKALGALFTSECLVIAEYLEAVIPIVYGIYLLIIVHLPAARYHVDFGGKLGMVLLYGLLEWASFGMFVIVLQRKCGLNAVYHLAFVLETQSVVVQTKLIVWMIALASLQVPHFGKLR